MIAKNFRNTVQYTIGMVVHKKSMVVVILIQIVIPLIVVKLVTLILLADTVQKNHYKENMRRIHRIQAQSKKKQFEAQVPTEMHQKSTKYKNVPSKVFLQVLTLHTCSCSIIV